MIEIFYLSIYVISLLLIGVATIITGETYGEAIDVHLDKMTLCILLLIYLLTYVFTYCLYKKHKDNYINIKVPKMKVNKKRMHIFYFVCLVISAYGTIVYGIGRVGGNVTTSLSFLFNIIKFSEFFPLYYVVARDERKGIYWINNVLYCFIQVMQGWSGWILTVAVLEVFFQEKKSGLIRKVFKLFKARILSVLAIICGGFLYYYVSPLKNSIRYGADIKWFRITLLEGFTSLVERFCNFPVYTSAWQNMEEMQKMYQQQGIFLSEFKSIFCPIVPSFIMPNKDIRSMGNIVLQAMWPTIKTNTSTGYGFFMYWFTLAKCNWADFIITLLAFIVGCIITFCILKSFDNEEHDCQILFFMFLVSIAVGTPVSRLFGYGYIAAIYLIIPMIVLGVIKVSVIRRN